MYLQIIFIIVSTTSVLHANEMKTVFQWNFVDFQWPDTEVKQQAILAAAYKPENNPPLALARWKNKLFITIPRWKLGVASTLNYVNLDDTSKSPLLIPYPSWKSNFILFYPSDNNSDTAPALMDGDDAPIVSVFRVWVDTCDRLWVLDNGVDDFFGNQKPISRRSILIYDLNTDTLIKRYYFKKSDQTDATFLGNIVVDVSGGCGDAFAYVADMAGFSLLVYSLQQDDSWRVSHLYMLPDPLQGEVLVGGVRAHWKDGVLGLTLSKVNKDGFRTLYFHSLTSTTQFEVSTQVIQNKTWANSFAAFDDFKITGNRGPKAHSPTSCLDEQTGVIFYSQINKNGISCWRSDKTMNVEGTPELIFQNEETLEFPADIKIDEDRQLWVISDRLPKYLYGSHKADEINTRILCSTVDAALDGSKCF